MKLYKQIKLCTDKNTGSKKDPVSPPFPPFCSIVLLIKYALKSQKIYNNLQSKSTTAAVQTCRSFAEEDAKSCL